MIYANSLMEQQLKWLIISIMLCSLSACSQNKGPGYGWDLFKNTPNWELAQALKQEDSSKIKELLKNSSININFQESVFGQTLLHLAIGNDELISTRILLENGAKVNIRDSDDASAIHEASEYPRLRKNAVPILSLVIRFGAKVNDTLIDVKRGHDTVAFEVPLMEAANNLPCAKLLLENGASPYFKAYGGYGPWTLMLSDNIFDGIYVAKYIIIDKGMLIPNPITSTINPEKPGDIFYFLHGKDYGGDKEKQRARQDIIDYLKRIDFPKNGVYQELN